MLIALVEHLKTSLVRFMGQELAPTKVQKLQQKVLGIVRAQGGRVNRRELQRAFGQTTDTFKETLRDHTDSADALGHVANAYHRRTGRPPDRERLAAAPHRSVSSAACSSTVCVAMTDGSSVKPMSRKLDRRRSGAMGALSHGAS